MRKLIGISGKARSGKDTVAKYLWVKYAFSRIAFADPVKLAAQAIFGLSHELTWSDEFKEKEVAYWGMSPRQMFQKVGTEAGRNIFGCDLWLKRWNLTYSQFKDTDDIVVPDVRFENEAVMIRGSGGVIVHLKRPGVESVNAHVSEDGIEWQEGDIVLINDGTIDDLTSLIDDLVEGMEMRS